MKPCEIPCGDLGANIFLQSVETKMDTTSGRNSNLLITLKTPSSQRSTGLVSSRSGDSYHQRDREMSPLMEKRLQKMSPTVTRGRGKRRINRQTDLLMSLAIRGRLV